MKLSSRVRADDVSRRRVEWCQRHIPGCVTLDLLPRRKHVFTNIVLVLIGPPSRQCEAQLMFHRIIYGA